MTHAHVKWNRGTPLVVRWLRLCLPMQGVPIWPLVGEIRSHKPHSQSTKTQTRSNIVTSSIKIFKKMDVLRMVKESIYNAGDLGLIPGLWRCLGEGNGNPRQYPCLGNPWTEEPGRLQSMRLQRVGHDWTTKQQQLLITTPRPYTGSHEPHLITGSLYPLINVAPTPATGNHHQLSSTSSLDSALPPFPLHAVHGVLKAGILKSFPFPSPVDHVFSELSTMTRPSWVALHSVAQGFIELDKAMVHVISLISFLWLWFTFPLMDKDKRVMKASWWERLTEGETASCSDGRGHAQ